MKKFLREFKSFALKGNVMNLAVGVIIGSAFQGVVNSLTQNILSPIIGIFAGVSFEAMHIEIFGVDIRYGAFATTVINFIIMAFVVFLIVKLMNKLAEGPDDKKVEVATKTCSFCFTEINAAAVRCPACTSNLSNAKKKS